MTVVVILAFIFGAWCGYAFHARFVRSYIRLFGLEQFRRVYVEETTDYGTGDQQ